MKTKAKWAKPCKCGAAVSQGDEIDLVKNELGKWIITICPTCNPQYLHAKDQPEQPEQEIPAEQQKLQVRVKYDGTHNESGWGRVTCEYLDGTPLGCPDVTKFTVVGMLHLPSSVAGDTLEVVGTFENDLKWGLQFKTSQAATFFLAQTEEGLASFLKRNMPGVGPKKARAIIDHFAGVKGVFEALDKNPEKLAEIKGITSEMATAIGEAYKAQGSLKDFNLFAANVGMEDHMIAKAVTAWDYEAQGLIQENPYVLMELRGVGFAKADSVALKTGVKLDDPRRCAAVAELLLESAEQAGHTYVEQEMFTGACDRRVEREDFDRIKAARATGLSSEQIMQGVMILCEERTVVRKKKTIRVSPVAVVNGTRIALLRLDAAEAHIADKLVRMLA